MCRGFHPSERCYPECVGRAEQGLGDEAATATDWLSQTHYMSAFKAFRGPADTGFVAVFFHRGYHLRSKSMAIAVVVLAIGAAPAVAAQTTALRTVKPAGQTVRPSAVWTPSPTSGIKWNGGASGIKWAVWIR